MYLFGADVTYTGPVSKLEEREIAHEHARTPHPLVTFDDKTCDFRSSQTKW